MNQNNISATETENAPEINSTEKEFIKFYMEQTWIEMRHLETLRERVTFLVVTLSIAIIGFSINQGLKEESWIFSALIIALGLFGLLMTLKIYSLHNLDQKRLDHWYDYLKKFCGNDPQVIKIRDAADEKSKSEQSFFEKLSHHFYWSGIHIFVIIAGIIILLITMNIL